MQAKHFRLVDGKLKLSYPLAMPSRVYNFSAGPAALPLSALTRAREELLSFRGLGMSVMEMSHRAKAFERLKEETEKKLRHLLKVPDNYEILFLQGGASLQFAMVPMNLYRESDPVEVIHTGVWTGKAIQELQKIAQWRNVGLPLDGPFHTLPDPESLKLSENASYVHICSNNTIEGTQWQVFPETKNVPLVCDMSSDIASRPVEIHRFGLIFAGAQKNLGPAGLTVVILRRDLADRCPPEVPTMLQYKTHIKARSLYNTPPVFAIYLTGLVLDWIQAEGGLAAMRERNEEKAKRIYDFIDKSDFYRCPVEPSVRSRMNIVFRIKEGNKELEEQFVAEAEKEGLVGLKGHRSVGGLRASLYNAVSLEAVKALVAFMDRFARAHR